MTLLARPGGRLLAMTVVYGYFLALIALGGHSRWDVFYVPDLQPAFLDMRSITSAWECTRRGIEVLAGNPCDPTGRPANYPKLWLLPAFLGLGQEATVALGLLTALALLAAVALLLRAASLWEGLVVGAALVSPPVMLGVERGNADLLVFAFLVVSLLLLRGRSSAARMAGHGALTLTAMLKLFPAFALVVLLRKAERRRLAGLAAVALGFLAYVLVTLDDVRTIFRVVPQATWFSYGAEVGPDSLRGWLARNVWGALGDEPVGLLATPLLLLLASGAATLIGWRQQKLVDWRRQDERGNLPSLATDAFIAGAAVYAGSFAVMRNWDYRLTFLLLTLPQLARWSWERPAPVPFPRFTLVTVLAALWLADTVDPARPLDEIANWLAFAGLTAGLTALLLSSRLSAPGRRSSSGQRAETRAELGCNRRGRTRVKDERQGENEHGEGEEVVEGHGEVEGIRHHRPHERGGHAVGEREQATGVGMAGGGEGLSQPAGGS